MSLLKPGAEERREQILSGPIVKTILILAIPVMISSALHTAYNIADTYFLGKLGAAEVGAPTAAWPILFTFLSIGMGISTAGVSLVSQHTGAGGHKEANEAAGQVFSFVMILGAVTAISGFVAARFLLTLVGTPPDVLPLATNYLRIVLLSMPFIFAYISFRFLLRGTGDMVTPMLIRALLVIVNVVLDPILIFGIGPFPQLGVTGAATATALSRTIAAIVGIYLLFNDRVDISFTLKDMKLKLDWIKKILDIGLPATVARAGSALGFVFMFALVANFGKNPVAAYGIGRRVVHLITIAIWGFAGASMTMVGQNIGGGNKERAEEIVKKAIMVALLIMVMITVPLFFFRENLMQVFIADEAVIAEGARYLAIFSISIPFFGIFRIFDSTYRGTGHTKPAMVLSLFRIWALRLGLSYLLGYAAFGVGLDLGVLGIWIGMACSNIIAAFLSFIYFSTGRWKSKTIEEERSVQP